MVIILFSKTNAKSNQTQRRIDGILVWKLDRFGRSLKALVTTLEELRSLGIQFVSYTENLDFSPQSSFETIGLELHRAPVMAFEHGRLFLRCFLLFLHLSKELLASALLGTVLIFISSVITLYTSPEESRDVNGNSLQGFFGVVVVWSVVSGAAVWSGTKSGVPTASMLVDVLF
jgi:hypothetical protein